MGIRYAESLRCSIRARWSVFGLQQLYHDTLAQAAHIDETIEHIDACRQILQEMRNACVADSKMSISLWLHLRKLQARKEAELRSRETLRCRGQFAIPRAFENLLASIEFQRYPLEDDSHSPKVQFLSTLVLTGEITPGEFSLANLGEEFFSIRGSFPDLAVTLRIGSAESPETTRQIHPYPNPHHTWR
ncbi:hypothetical protein I8H83_00170 [Candidatus Saccharibacteria bacterium]|nr:hypothetical protein [Candidatus Saccharibacteria bacterium]